MPKPLLCPYCFDEFSAAEVEFRCTNPRPDMCAPVEDEKLARYLELGSQLSPVVFDASVMNGGNSSNKAICPKCNSASTKRVCPRCHNELPWQFGETEALHFGLIGARAVGKSNYVGVLVHELTHRVGTSFNMAFTAQDERTIKRYRRDFEDLLFRGKTVVPPTRVGNVEERYPLIYRMSINQEGSLGRKQRIASVSLFDTAGESFDDFEKTGRHARYVAKADGLIFLLDPLQIRAVRDGVKHNVPLPEEGEDPIAVLGRVEQVLRQHRKLSAAQKVDTPVAISFSKIDAVRSLLDKGSPLLRRGAHDGFFNTNDFQLINDNLRAHMSNWQPNLVQLLDHNFSNYAFFGVSALGTPPSRDNRIIKGISPFRVEDPLLWLLHRHGLIPGK